MIKFRTYLERKERKSRDKITLNFRTYLERKERKSRDKINISKMFFHVAFMFFHVDALPGSYFIFLFFFVQSQ